MSYLDFTDDKKQQIEKLEKIILRLIIVPANILDIVLTLTNSLFILASALAI